MIPGSKAEDVPLLRPVRLCWLHARKTKKSEAAASRPNAWWWRGAVGISMAYIGASQALLDIPGWSASAFVLALVLGALMVVGAFRRVWKLRLGLWLVIPTLFLSYYLLRCFSGVKEMAPFNTFLQVFSAFLGGASLAMALRAGVSFKALVYAQVAANALQIAFVVLGVGENAPAGEETFRYSGLTGNANLLALQLTLGACLIWLLPRKVGIFPCVFAVAAVAFAVVATGSRKAILIGFFFFVLVFIQVVALIPPKRRRLLVTAVVAIACLTGLSLARWIHQNGTEILAVQRAVDYEDSSYSKRTEMIEQGLQLWQQATWFGNGADAFRELSGQGTYSHNNYVELLCNLGLVGALLFYSLYAQVLFRAMQARPVTRIYCWIVILMLLLADLGYVSYSSKQSIMIVMLLTVVTTSRYGFLHQRRAGKGARPGRRHLRAKLRRFVMQN